jgi:hypothetical protein
MRGIHRVVDHDRLTEFLQAKRSGFSGRQGDDLRENYALGLWGPAFAGATWGWSWALLAPANAVAAPHVNSASTLPRPASSIVTLSPGLSHTVFTRLPVSTSWPLCRPLPSEAR